ncbi:MAG: hypothetical protein U9O78_02795 [Patescibacteria group bacterium]|nr:hypothetical protein [Patescibacteria group bacterium]
MWRFKNKFHNIPILSGCLIFIYLFSRVLILLFPPPNFTEIIYSYMPYAHLWAGGMKPYLEQWYEYPPATIPLFYIPHLIDRESFQFFWHLNYSQAYKLILLLSDFAIFGLIWKVLKKFKVQDRVFSLSILFYTITTLKAHHFIYDTMDLVFALAIVFGLASPILFEKKWNGLGLEKLKLGRFFGWLGFFLATAFKYINAPLGALYALLELEKKDFKKSLTKIGIMMGLAFGLVWGLPLAIYRSSLQVSFLFHQFRGLQIDSAGSTIARIINAFTHSEKVEELHKNYEMVGPISSQILHVLEILFPLSIVLFLIWGMVKILRTKFSNKLKPQSELHVLRIYLTLAYIFLFMIVGKVLSTPFLLWHLPLLAMFPFKNVKTQLRFLIPSLVIIFVSMTGVPRIALGVFDTHILVAVIRTSLFLYLFLSWIHLKRDSSDKGC